MLSKKLNLESLDVDSFETADVQDMRGTVMGHDDDSGPPQATGDNSNCLCDPTQWGMCTLYEAECHGGSGSGWDTYDYTCDRTY